MINICNYNIASASLLFLWSIIIKKATCVRLVFDSLPIPTVGKCNCILHTVRWQLLIKSVNDKYSVMDVSSH